MAKKNKRRATKTETSSEKPVEYHEKKEIEETPVTRRRTSLREGERELIFGKRNYIVLGIGLALVLVGFLLMSGGAMPDPDTWDDNIIYSTRRITIAPLVVLIGLAVVVFSIFRSSGSINAVEEDDIETV